MTAETTLLAMLHARGLHFGCVSVLAATHGITGCRGTRRAACSTRGGGWGGRRAQADTATTAEGEGGGATWASRRQPKKAVAPSREYVISAWRLSDVEPPPLTAWDVVGGARLSLKHPRPDLHRSFIPVLDIHDHSPLVSSKRAG